MSSIRRESRTPVLGLGERYGTSYLIPIIRENVKNGNIKCKEIVLTGKERLDTLAGKFYNDSSLFWILCACSGIGYSLQVPTGTLIKVPKLADILKYV